MLLASISVQHSLSVTVSKDGQGDFTTIQEAVSSAPNENDSNETYNINVKSGTYYEYVIVPKEKAKIRMTGEGMNTTVITGNRSVEGGVLHTSETATFTVYANNFILEDVTVANTAGAVKEQAVALFSASRFSIYSNCRIKGYQDTLYIDNGPQFYTKCEIYGTTDFIFGSGVAVIQSSTIKIQNGLPGKENVIVAHRGSSQGGFSLQFCTVLAEKGYHPTQTYLGRPWDVYATTVYIQSYLGDFISPAGWEKWKGRNEDMVDKLFYGEFSNFGPGANLSQRVKWRGYHILNRSAAEEFTVKKLLSGDEWIPPTGIPYIGGLN